MANDEAGIPPTQKPSSNFAELVLVKRRPEDKSIEINHHVVLPPGGTFKDIPNFGQKGAEAFHDKLGELTNAFTNTNGDNLMMAKASEAINEHIKQRNRELGSKGSVSLDITPTYNPDGSLKGHSFTLTTTIILTKREMQDHLKALREKDGMRDVGGDHSKLVGPENGGDIIEAKAAGNHDAVKRLIDQAVQRQKASRPAEKQRGLEERSRSEERSGVR